MEPSPDRDDWASVADVLDRCWVLAHDELPPALDRELALVTADVERDRVRIIYGEAIESVMGLLHAAGRSEPARILLRIGQRLVPSDSEVALRMATAQEEPGRLMQLTWAWWLLARGKERQADRMAKQLCRGSSDAIARSAKRLLDAPRAVDSPPELPRSDAQAAMIGAVFFGRRDELPDGSYVATLCATVLYFPVFPMAAYRIRRIGHGKNQSLQFLGRVRMSPVVKLWRSAVVVVVLAVSSVQIHRCASAPPGPDFDVTSSPGVGGV